MPLFDFFKPKPPAMDKHSAWELPLGELLQPFLRPIMSFLPYEVKAGTDKGYKEVELVFRCVNIISDQLSGINFVVFDSNDQEVASHPINDLLYLPNQFMPPSDFYGLLWKQLEIAGEGFFYYDKTLKQLAPLYPDKVDIIPSNEPGKLIKGYKYDNGKVFLPDEVLHLKYIDPSDGFHGVPPLQACYRHVDIVKAMDEWNFNSFKNRLVPDLAITLDQENMSVEALQEIKNSIGRQVAGPSNARKPLVLPGGRDIKQLGMNAVEMDFIAGRKSSLEAISVAFGVPLPMLGIYDNGTFSNVESAAKDFWENTLLPKANNFCNTVTWFFTMRGLLKNGQYIGFRKKEIKALQRNYSDRVNDADKMARLLIDNGFNPQEVMVEINSKYELGLDINAINWVEPMADDPALVPGNNGQP